MLEAPFFRQHYAKYRKESEGKQQVKIPKNQQV